MKLQIVHYADIQIEVRVTGEGAQRLNEFALALKHVETKIAELKPDAVIIPGDIFQYCDANADEQKLFSEHLHTIAPHVSGWILVTDGNHDVKQRANGIIEAEVKRNLVTPVDAVISAMKHPKIKYFRHTGLYPLKFVNWENQIEDCTVTFAVWSQLDKWSAIEPKPAYSPWINNEVPDGPLIELFHDPIRGCKDFTGSASEHFANYGITLADFAANLIIAGDIHAPDWLWDADGNKLFTYSSSLVQRNFGEGDYYTNDRRTIKGNSKHGFNIIEFDTESNRATACKWVPVAPPVSRHTFRLTETFVWPEAIKTLQIEDPADWNHVRLVCQANMPQFIEHQAELVEWFKTNWQCQVSLDFAKDVIAVDVDEDAFDDLAEVIDVEKILEISKRYISSLVDKTSTIDKEHKQWSKDYMFALFQEQMSTIDLTSDSVDIRLLDADVTNFMSFGEDVHLDFFNMPITVIAGTNGIGKTTIHHFIKWMLKDTISDQLDVRQKKANYLLYFNKGSELDDVLGRIRLSVNGQIVNLTKTLTRTWKKGQKDIFANNIPDRLASTPQMKLTIESEELTSSKTEEVEAWLDKLITFRELTRLMFVNPLSIDRLIMTKPEDLSQEFLTTIGLDFTNNLLAVYDKMKDERLAPLTKPSMTVEETVSAILVQEQDSEALQIHMQQFLQESSILSEDIANKRVDIDAKRMTLHQVPLEKDVQISIDNIVSEKLPAAELAITNAIDKHATILSDIDKLNLNDTNALLDTVQSEIVDLSAKSSEVQGSILTAKQGQETLQSKQLVRTAEIKAEKADVSMKFLQAKEQLNKSIASTKDEIADVKSTWQNRIAEAVKSKQTKKDEVQLEIDKKTTEFNEASAAIAIIDERLVTTAAKSTELSETIESHKTEKVCSSCGSELKGEALRKIEQMIIDKSADLTKLHEDSAKLSTAKDSYSTKTSLIEIALVGLKSDITKLSTEIEEIEKLKNWQIPVSNEWFKVDDLIDSSTNLHVNLEGNLQKIDRIEEALRKQDDELAESLKNDSVLFALSEDFLKIDKYIDTLNESIVQLSQDISNKTVERDRLKLVIASIHELHKDLTDANDGINSAKLSEAAVKSELQHLRSQLELCKINTGILNEIGVMTIDLNALLAKESEFTTGIAETKLKLGRTTDKKEQLVKQIEEIKLYKATDNSLKLYKKLLGKQGLPQYVFAHLVPLINKKLNESLEGVNFRLLFDQETLELRFFDLQKQVSSPVIFISGMERTVVGLALVHILRLLNRSKRFNVLMIDEISGTLNDGKSLTYQSKNYKKLVHAFIVKLSEDVNIWIVDHVLEFWNARRIEVQPGTSGATIVDVTEHVQ